MTDRPSNLRARIAFYIAALLWLPAGVAVTAAVRWWPLAAPGDVPSMTMIVLVSLASLAVAAPCGLPLAFACRWLGRMGYRCAAWMAGVALGTATVAVLLSAGLFGPVGIAIAAIPLSLPVWIAAFWLARTTRRVG